MINNKYVRKVLDMSPEKRRHICLDNNKIKKRFYYKPDKEYTSDEMLLWASERGITSVRQFYKYRNNDGPSYQKILKNFGSWGNFKEKLISLKKDFYSNIIGNAPTDAEYLLSVVVQYDLWTSRSYEKARIKNPEIIPSFYWVKYHFGRWKNLIILAEQVCIEHIISRYVLLREKLGRWATYTECKKEMIDLEPLYEIHGGKKNLDRFLEKSLFKKENNKDAK